MHLLVPCVTKHGSTAEIAEAIGEVLRPHVAPDVAPIGIRGHRTFGGRLLETTAAEAGILETHRIGDLRHWEHIRAWAREIAEALVVWAP